MIKTFLSLYKFFVSKHYHINNYARCHQWRHHSMYLYTFSNHVAWPWCSVCVVSFPQRMNGKVKKVTYLFLVFILLRKLNGKFNSSYENSSILNLCYVFILMRLLFMCDVCFFFVCLFLTNRLSIVIFNVFFCWFIFETLSHHWYSMKHTRKYDEC